MKYRIGFECNRCRMCIEVCPAGAIITEGEALVINGQCTECGECLKACPLGAIYQGDDDFDEM